MASPPPKRTAEAFANTAFDFLIIGGGTAGLAVAARLSEDPLLTVGVLEAGGPAFGDGVVDRPGLAGSALGTGLDWGFATLPQAGLGGREVPWARGKVLGGSSALNYMTWNRAGRHDYDDWAELGNAGWGWDDLLPFFKKSECYHAPTSDTQIAAHVASHEGILGQDGPVQVSYPGEFTASHGLWHSTLNTIGVETNDDPLGGTNVGCWTSVCSVDPESASRSYAATAYYLPNAGRPNLVLLTEAEVQEILLVKEGNKDGWAAKGVRFTQDGADFTVHVSREIILSAGSVQSPQLLELSGVGASTVLEAAGIAVKVDNPNVGENLQDHLTTTLVFEVDPSLRNPDDLKTEVGLAAATEEYARSRTGPLATLPISMSYVPVTCFVSQEALDAILEPPSAVADSSFLERDTIIQRRFSRRAKELGHVEFIFDLGNWNPYFTPNPANGKKYASMLQILQYPFSRGSVHIRPPPPSAPDSTPTTTKPHATVKDGLAIDAGYYSGRLGHRDLELAMHSHRFAEAICATQPLASIIRAQVDPPPAESRDNAALRDWLRRTMVTDWHPVGTCAMGGRARAQAGVVDERLRVYGVRGLRVVDASVMPVQISAHLQATVYAIAEKAAHMILEDLGGLSR